MGTIKANICVFFIGSHVNRTTQFENPVSASKRTDHKSNPINDSRQEPPSMTTAAALAKKQEAEAAARYNGRFPLQPYRSET